MKWINGNTPVDSKWLDLDNKCIYDSQLEYKKAMKNRIGGTEKVFTNDHGQVLIAGSERDFTKCEAIIICKRLTGILPTTRTEKE